VSGSVSASAAAVTVFCTVHQDSPYAPATSATTRPADTTASSTTRRSRVVTRALSGTSSLTSTNVRRVHSCSAQEKRRLTSTTSTGPAIGTSANRCRRRWWTRAERTPQEGHGASVAVPVTIT
jgi:uncharacterized protein (UPF0210 family)